MNTFELDFTCEKCKNSYTGLVMEDELAMSSEGYFPLDLTCQHCGWDNQQNYDYFLKQTELDSLLQTKQEQEKERQEALKQAELARLLAQCSTPPPKHRFSSNQTRFRIAKQLAS
ncbi:hypothetical protein [Helicobacter sp. T3_23-1059]